MPSWIDDYYLRRVVLHNREAEDNLDEVDASTPTRSGRSYFESNEYPEDYSFLEWQKTQLMAEQVRLGDPRAKPELIRRIMCHRKHAYDGDNEASPTQKRFAAEVIVHYDSVWQGYDEDSIGQIGYYCPILGHEIGEGGVVQIAPKVLSEKGFKLVFEGDEPLEELWSPGNALYIWDFFTRGFQRLNFVIVPADGGYGNEFEMRNYGKTFYIRSVTTSGVETIMARG